jgi:hypothetical protein
VLFGLGGGAYGSRLGLAKFKNQFEERRNLL